MSDEVIIPDSEVGVTKTDILDSLSSDDDSSKDDDGDIAVDLDNDEPTPKSSEDEDEEASKKSKDKDEEDDEEEEPELKLDDEDELELSRIPKRQEIKAAYPDIFKKFPALEHVIAREYQYSEIFPTLSDAKQARERLGTLAAFEGELFSGNLEGVLKAVKTSDEKAYNKIANGLLDTVARVDPAAHLNILNNVTKGVLKFIHDKVKNGKDDQSEQLLIATKLINKFIYESYEVTGPEAREPERVDPRQEELSKERATFEKTKFQSAFTEITGDVNSILNTAVGRDIDIKGILPPYVKTNLVKDILSELDRQMGSDTRFRGLVNKLWEQAKANNYDSDSKAKLKKALKEKAKTVLPGIMRAKKVEAMKGLSTSSRRREVDDDIPESRGIREPRKNSSSITSTRRDDDKGPRPGESVRDYLMRD